MPATAAIDAVQKWSFCALRGQMGLLLIAWSRPAPGRFANPVRLVQSGSMLHLEGSFSTILRQPEFFFVRHSRRFNKTLNACVTWAPLEPASSQGRHPTWYYSPGLLPVG
jgi:hypothetical protein